MLEPMRVPLLKDFRSTISGVLDQNQRIEQLVDSAVNRGLASVYFVGCGASHFAAVPAHHILERFTTDISIVHMSSAEFVRCLPARVGARALVVACSHSGNTAETVAAARRARQRGATVAGITAEPESELGGAVDVLLDYPSTNTVAEPKVIMFSQVAFALLERLGAPCDYSSVHDSCRMLPEALYSVRDEVEEVAERVAGLVADAPLVYVLGSGPAYGAARALGMCYLQEMQWIHAAVIDSGEFLHGPVETADETVPMLFLMTEDETRSISEHALQFAQRLSMRTVAVDTRAFTLRGIPPHIRPLISPIALVSAARRVLDYVAAVRGHDPTKRRHMVKSLSIHASSPAELERVV